MRFRVVDPFFGHAGEYTFNEIKLSITGQKIWSLRRLYKWKGLMAKDEIPRIAEGKYLKLLYDLHDKRGTLNVDRKEPNRTIARPATSSRDASGRTRWRS